MATELRLPSIGGTDQEKITQIARYLYQLIPQLNFNFHTIEKGVGVADFVVEQTTTNGWFVRKWNSGIAECWYKRSMKTTPTTAVGCFYSVEVSTINYPIEFYDNPICQVTCEAVTDTTSLFVSACREGTRSYAPPVTISGSEQKEINCNILYHATGKWKKA